MRFVRLFLDPVNCLVRAGELADTADLPPVEVLEPAVGTTLWTIKFRDGDSLTVELFALLKNCIRADLRTEITTLAPGLVNGEFHEKCPNVYYCSPVEKNLFFMPGPILISFFADPDIFLFGMLHHLVKKIIAVCIDTYHQREVVKFDHPDRFCHTEIFEKYPFYGHVR